ncbi:MAG: ROK family protein [Armatimonadetes bacterium]|nr:ROK family protein [Armatimonadota bacterium]
MSKTESKFIGVDVGGTKILALLVDDDGEVLGRSKRPTQQEGQPLADQVAAVIDDLLAATGTEPGEIAGIGLAVPGVVNSQTGELVHAPNLAVDDPWIAERIRERYGVPVAIGNDVNLGTLAEAWHGAGQGASSVVGIFVGTGIGGGVVIDGRVHVGAHDQGGEVGHMVIVVDGPPCGCGNLGCWEALASRTAIEREVRKAVDAGRPTVLAAAAEEEHIRSGPLGKALKAGDEVAVEVMTRVAHYLAQGLLTIKHLIDPEVIVLGGGVMEACGDFLMPLIEAEVRADKLRASREGPRLVASQLSDDAVALGAAVLARSEVAELAAAAACACPPAGEEPTAAYPRLDSVSFGVVVVEGEEIPNDIYIRADGKLGKRKKKAARKKYGTSHVVDAEELQKVCKGQPRTVIIGAGFQGMVRLTDDAKEFLNGLGADWQVLRTPEAVEAFNAARGPKALLLHVTC